MSFERLHCKCGGFLVPIVARQNAWFCKCDSCELTWIAYYNDNGNFLNLEPGCEKALDRVSCDSTAQASTDVRPLFHVRFVENGVEQEQILVGVPDGNGNFNIHLPTPCTLLAVKPHGFPWCEVCDGDPRTAVAEWLMTAGVPPDRLDAESFGPTTPLEEIRKRRIRAEVEAMDWPEVIGE